MLSLRHNLAPILLSILLNTTAHAQTSRQIVPGDVGIQVPLTPGHVIVGGPSSGQMQDSANASTGGIMIGAGGGVITMMTAFGYGIGSGVGGTVTQATSRTTGVAINTPTGAITLFSAAGSTTAATFTVTNSTVAATDVVILNQKSGTNLYNLHVTAIAAGSFNITFYTTGGTATDAPVINFAIIKGSSN